MKHPGVNAEASAGAADVGGNGLKPLVLFPILP